MSNRPIAGNDPCINQWNKYLNEFDAIMDTKKDRKEKLLNLKERASADQVLTIRQRDGIIARADWQIHLMKHPEDASTKPELNEYMKERMKGQPAK